jgi:hypothetical protein
MATEIGASTLWAIKQHSGLAFFFDLLHILLLLNKTNHIFKS